MLLGITGGIATGKSTVSRLLRQNGAIVFSADEAARAILNPCGPVVQRIAAEFGLEVLLPDGTLNREALGKKVFADPEVLRRLEKITHPPILRLLRAQIEAARQDFPARSLVAVEVPLLYEAGMETWFDTVLVVTAPPEVQLARLMARNSLKEEEARRRLEAQWPLEEKAARSQFVLDNGGTPTQTEKALNSLLSQWHQAGFIT